MITRIGHGKIFFGWWTVLYTGLISGIGFGFSSYGFSVFFKDIAAELGMNRAVTSLASGVGALTGGLISAPTGRLADRLGPRWIIFGGIIIGAIGMATMYFVHSTLTFVLAWGLLMFAGLFVGLTIAVEQALTNWFIRKRGLAQGIKFSLISVGGVIALPTITWLVTGYGWRLTCVIWGAFLLLVSPLTLFLVKQKRPEYYGLLPDGASIAPGSSTDASEMLDRGTEYALDSQETEFTLRQAIRTRAFWVISVANFAFAMVGTGFSIHIIPFLTDAGIDKATASGMTSMMVLLMIPSRFFGGFSSDRIGKGSLQFLLAGAFVIPVIGIIQYLIHPSTATIYTLLIFYGLNSGLGITLIILIMGRYFGRKAFGSIFGISNIFQSAAMFLGPIYYGWIYDTTGSYITAFTIFAIIAPICAAAICLLGRAPKLPAAGGTKSR